MFGATKLLKINDMRNFCIIIILKFLIPPTGIANIIVVHPWTCYDQIWFWKRLFLIEGGLWYLQYLFVWYVIFYIVHRYHVVYMYRWYLISICIVTIFWFWRGAPSEHCLYFSLGMLLGDYYGKDIPFNRRVFLRISAISCVLFVCALTIFHTLHINTEWSNKTIIVMYLALDFCVLAIVPLVSIIRKRT